MQSAPNITLCCVTSSQRRLSENALLRSRLALNFGRVLLLSDQPPRDPSIDFVEIPAIKTLADYNRFILHQLHEHIETEFVLLIQYDGFVLNGSLWQEQFLSYDYIGARWPWYQQNAVGNGGFSLRSRKLLQATARAGLSQFPEPEDDVICRQKRALLEREWGIKYAPDHVADAFSLEFAQARSESFGFHGLHHFHEVYSEANLLRIIDMLDDSIFAGNTVLVWLEKMHQVEFTTGLRALAPKILQHQSRELLCRNCDIHGFDAKKIENILNENAGVNRPKIATIINFCSNDYKFIGPCIASVKELSDEIIVSYCDHFFNGEPENFDLIRKAAKENPEARFVQFPYEADYYANAASWHNRGRAEGFKALSKKDFDWLLVLDADEIADPLFSEFVSFLGPLPYDSMRILSYWYYRDICWQAKQFEDSAVLLRNDPILTFDFFEHSVNERLGTLFGRSTQGAHLRNETGAIPLFHHYSWARTQDEMFQKVKGWAHKHDRDWVQMINQEFERDFNESCQDYVHGYSYRRVTPLAVFSTWGHPTGPN